MIELWKKCDFYERIIIVVFCFLVINQVFGLGLYHMGPDYIDPNWE